MGLVVVRGRSVTEMIEQRARPLVLIVEDDPCVSNAIALTLRNAGLATREFAGLASFDDSLRDSPRVVIIDLWLQRTDGVEVLKALCDYGFTGAVQLISGSSAAVLADVERIGSRRWLRMLPPLRKPFRMAAVRDAILAELALTTTTSRSVVCPYKQEPVRVNCVEAAENDWLEAWFQPKIDMDTGRIIGAECLARVRHPTHGLLQPASFIPDATLNDLSVLSDFMIRQACHLWQEYGLRAPKLRLAVNLPSSLLLTMPLADLVRETALEHPTWPGLVLEVTEEQALAHLDTAHETAIQLSLYRVDLSIDDFGIGYSSLNRLRELPFRELKLDRSLVAGCHLDATRKALLRAIVDMAHALGAKVVAEGVETVDELNFVKAAGCDIVQGFVISKPLPKNEFLALLDCDEPRSFMLPARQPSIVARSVFGLR